jgi:hypothetical protein
VNNNRTPYNIVVQPWFKDHSVGGKIVLPAVETMLLLAAKCFTVHPELDVRIMENGHFGKFLEIPPSAPSVAALIECTADANGRMQAKLLSHMQLKTMARIKEHGEIFFSLAKTGNQPPPTIDPQPLAGPVAKVNAAQLYQDLVPFGPHYHTLQETLYLSNCQAWGKLKAPLLPFIDPVQVLLGSPFPFDGALHAACVLGQRSANFVPFPVGFDRRMIIRPTQPGACYDTRVTMISMTHDELIFDLAIFNNDGQLYEIVNGVKMRDVSKTRQH